jgi:predicted dehydrogenase
MACIDIGIIGCGNISHSYLNGAALTQEPDMIRQALVAQTWDRLRRS